jgi:hypothetical protein
MATWQPDDEQCFVVVCHCSSLGKSVPLPPLNFFVKISGATLRTAMWQPNGKWRPTLPFTIIVYLIQYLDYCSIVNVGATSPTATWQPDDEQ